MSHRYYPKANKFHCISLSGLRAVEDSSVEGHINPGLAGLNKEGLGR